MNPFAHFEDQFGHLKLSDNDAALHVFLAGWNDAMDQKPAEANEPVAYIEHHKAGDNLVWDNPGGKHTPLYTSPPAQRKPLTDEEIQTIAKEHIAVGTRSFEEFVRRIEAAHGIKG